jgi:hypothetical protein
MTAEGTVIRGEDAMLPPSPRSENRLPSKSPPPAISDGEAPVLEVGLGALDEVTPPSPIALSRSLNKSPALDAGPSLGDEVEVTYDTASVDFERHDGPGHNPSNRPKLKSRLIKGAAPVREQVVHRPSSRPKPILTSIRGG